MANLDNVTWREVHAPKTWRPGEGECLVGYFRGVFEKDGMYGAYYAVRVKDLEGQTWHVSGSHIVNLIDAAEVEIGGLIEITFLERIEIDDGERTFKKFELRVAV